MTITESGVYDLPAEEYHADPVKGGSLTSSGIRALLPPSTPARYRYDLDHQPAPSRTFDLGHAAHKLVLGVGPELVLVDRDRWDTNEVKARLAQIRGDGGIPLKRKDWDAVHAMADAIRAHPLAGAILDSALGVAERTLVWQDPDTGVWCRALLDWMGTAPTGTEIVVDYKTSESAHPGTFGRSAGNYGYDVQEAHYEDGWQALFGRPIVFVFVVQEKDPPYLVSVVQLDPEDVARARAVCRAGRAVYRDCTAAGQWPGYTPDIAHISLPRYVRSTREGAIYGDQY